MTERPLTLDDLLSLREGWDFEAKAAQGRDGPALPESFWETYSAMANSEGGLIALGIRERADRSLEVLGLAEPQRVETDLWNLLGNRQKVSANVLQRRHVQWLDIDGRLQQIIDMHGRDLTHLLRSLAEQRMFVPHGDRGGTWYTVAGPRPCVRGRDG